MSLGLQRAVVQCQLQARPARPRHCFQQGQALVQGPARRAAGRGALPVVAWGVLRKLGLQKPSFLPDFGREKRCALLLDVFGTPASPAKAAGLVDPQAAVRTEWGGRVTEMTGAEWVRTLEEVTVSFPDLSFTAATDGAIDKQGWAIVAVQVGQGRPGSAGTLERALLILTTALPQCLHRSPGHRASHRIRLCAPRPASCEWPLGREPAAAQEKSKRC